MSVNDLMKARIVRYSLRHRSLALSEKLERTMAAIVDVLEVEAVDDDTAHAWRNLAERLYADTNDLNRLIGELPPEPTHTREHGEGMCLSD